MTARYWLRIQRYPALRKLYRQYRDRSKSTGVNIWDAVILYETVRRDKPIHILEFGTGASTAYMALALMHNEVDAGGTTGALVSVESEKEFLEHQKNIFPEELKRYVEFVYGPVITRDFHGRQGFVYKNVPYRPYDLIWVDGPALTDTIRFSGDVIDLFPACSPKVRVLFDGRDETARTVSSLIGAAHHMKRYPHLHMTEIKRK